MIALAGLLNSTTRTWEHAREHRRVAEEPDSALLFFAVRFRIEESLLLLPALSAVLGTGLALLALDLDQGELFEAEVH